jgi:hypothetical protein
MKNKQFIYLYYQLSGEGVGFFTTMLGNEYVTTLDHPPYSSDLAPADFYLFTLVKLALKGQCFCDAEDIMKTSTEVLKRLSKNYFQECFQHLYSCYQKCTVAKGDHFEGNMA